MERNFYDIDGALITRRQFIATVVSSHLRRFGHMEHALRSSVGLAEEEGFIDDGGVTVLGYQAMHEFGLTWCS